MYWQHYILIRLRVSQFRTDTHSAGDTYQTYPLYRSTYLNVDRPNEASVSWVAVPFRNQCDFHPDHFVRRTRTIFVRKGAPKLIVLIQNSTYEKDCMLQRCVLATAVAYFTAQTDVMETFTESTTCFNIKSQQLSQNILVSTTFVDPECSYDFHVTLRTKAG